MTTSGKGLEGDSVKATARVRSNFANTHLMSAHFLAMRAREVELANADQPLGAFVEDLRAYATAGVISAHAAVEAYVNEVLFEPGKKFPSVPDEAMSLLAKLLEQRKLREKLEMLPRVAGGSPPDFGVSPGSDLLALTRLRNALVHYRPAWSDDRAEHEKLDRTLAGKFAPSRLFRNEPLFPRGCFCYACVRWAVLCARDFIVRYATQNGWPAGVLNGSAAYDLPPA